MTSTAFKQTCLVSVLALAIVTAISLAFPSVALAKVTVDNNELAQGENSVGGGTATLTETALNMANVTASSMSVDEDLTVSFDGGNDIGVFDIEGSANVEVNFTGDNGVEDIHAHDSSNVTINANGHNDFEEVEGFENANLTVNVTGENDFETIEGHDNANITVRGTECQKRDTLNIGDDESDSGLSAENGNVVIDHVTVNMESKTAVVGSQSGNVTIDTSKIASEEDNKFTEIIAGGTMKVIESVIEIVGTMHSDGKMTIEHSDVEADAPDEEYDASPYRVYSKTGIELVREKNGEVKEGELNGEKVWYVDTGDGKDVDLEADGLPGYYACKDKGVGTGDNTNPWGLAFLALASATTAGYAAKRRKDDAA
ncbi:MAG: LPXTG cell wall anchor domain-containing protein [Eggerthellaceae bacterium]|nr:LPXTG cell wall anchor domain-containing protein [Eggerthellaceae bacterium]